MHLCCGEVELHRPAVHLKIGATLLYALHHTVQTLLKALSGLLYSLFKLRLLLTEMSECFCCISCYRKLILPLDAPGIEIFHLIH